jgi:peptide/nickel transport system substrate-binding protein
VKCTWDTLAGKSNEKFRLNPRKSWYRNLEDVTTNGDDEVTFHLKRPQPYFIALLASGVSPVYPCHVTPESDTLPLTFESPRNVFISAMLCLNNIFAIL